MKRLAFCLALLIATSASAGKPRAPKSSSTPQIWPPGPDDAPAPKPKPKEPEPKQTEPEPEPLPPVPQPPAPPSLPPSDTDDDPEDDACAEAFDACREDCTIAHATDDTLHLPKGHKPPLVRCIARCQSQRTLCDEQREAGVAPSSRSHGE